MHLAYVAGLFDGEGSVGLSKNRNRYYPVVEITNTNLEVLREVQARFGGSINSKGIGNKKSWKAAYSWRMAWSRAVRFLKAIFPYLRIKRNQAILIFIWEAVSPYYRRYTKEDLALQKLIKQQLSWLNFRGPRSLSDPLGRVLAKSDYR